MIKRRLGLIGIIFSAVFILSIATGTAQGNTSQEKTQSNKPNIYINRVPIEKQIIFQDMKRVSERINNLLFTRVRADSPRQLFVDFYVSMSEVGKLQEELYRSAKNSPGLIWNQKEDQLIKRAEAYLEIASEAFDTRNIEPNNREWKAKEYSLKLKDVLDVLFDVLNEQIEIPTSEETTSDAWKVNNSNISVVKIETNGNLASFRFTSETIDDLDRMRTLTQSIRPKEGTFEEGIGVHQFSTPMLTHAFLYSPGGIVPPKAYFLIPESIRKILEIPAGSSGSVVSVVTIIAMLIGLLILSGIASTRLINAYIIQNRNSKRNEILEYIFRSKNNFYRSFIFSGIAISAYALSATTTYLIYGPLAGLIVNTLAVMQWLFVASALFAISESIGQLACATTLNSAKNNYLVKKKRLVNIIILISRSMGSLLTIYIFYILLLELGFTDQFLLAFSAVPGLAIGLGASKILSNIFAGISLQADRPVKVGEFCQIGQELGFIRNIGLRSIQLETLTGTISVPNHLLEDSNLTNYTDRDYLDNSHQIVEFKMLMPALILGHYDQICKDVESLLRKKQKLRFCLVKYGLNKSGTEAELRVALSTRIETWPEYNIVKEEVMKAMKLSVAVVSSTRQKILISRFTRSELLRKIPSFILEAIETDVNLKMTSCRLSDLKESAYEFTYDIASSYNYDKVGEFFDSLSTLRKRLIALFEFHEIDLAIPAYDFRSVKSQEQNDDNQHID